MAAADYVKTQLTSATHRVDGPLGTTYFQHGKPYAWMPAPRDAILGERPMLYTRTRDVGNDILLARGKRVTVQEYNTAVAALLH